MNTITVTLALAALKAITKHVRLAPQGFSQARAARSHHKAPSTGCTA